MAIVLDASVIAEYLIGRETASVLRTWVRRGEVLASRASAAFEDLRDLPARRWPSEPLLERIGELHDNVTTYDANYVALAEALDADLLTADRRLARGLEGIASCHLVALAI
jgi:predicted nucleic acid-binding protein